MDAQTHSERPMTTESPPPEMPRQPDSELGAARMSDQREDSVVESDVHPGVEEDLDLQQAEVTMHDVTSAGGSSRGSPESSMRMVDRVFSALYGAGGGVFGYFALQHFTAPKPEPALGIIDAAFGAYFLGRAIWLFKNSLEKK